MTSKSLKRARAKAKQQEEQNAAKKSIVKAGRCVHACIEAGFVPCCQPCWPCHAIYSMACVASTSK